MAQRKLLKAKVCLVGEAAVGKTSLIRRHVLGQFDEAYLQTVLATVSKKIVEVPLGPEAEPVSVEMAIWDVMGPQRFRELLTDSHFEGASGVIAVADLTRRQTLPALYEWIDRVDQVAEQAPVVLAVNKSDLARAAQLQETEILPVAKALQADRVMTSAKTGAGVNEAFQLLGLRLAERANGAG